MGHRYDELPVVTTPSDSDKLAIEHDSLTSQITLARLIAAERNRLNLLESALEAFGAGSFYNEFSISTTLSAQADELPENGMWFGRAQSLGHQSAMGLPVDAHVYVRIQSWNANNKLIEIWGINDPDNMHYIQRKYGSWGTWIKEPARDEITNSCKVIYISDKVGAQSAGAHGYMSVSFTVPSGYKTSGIHSLSIGHPGQASTAGFSVVGSVSNGVTGTNTAYVSYSVPYGNLSDSASDFGLFIHCVPSSWNIS